MFRLLFCEQDSELLLSSQSLFTSKVKPKNQASTHSLDSYLPAAQVNLQQRRSNTLSDSKLGVVVVV